MDLWLQIIAGLVVAIVLGVVSKRWQTVAAPAFYATVGGGVFFICMFLVAQTEQQIGALKKLVNDRPARPYFTLSRAIIQKNAQGKEELAVSVQNNQVPAEKVVSQILIIGEAIDPTIAPIDSITIENANAVGINAKVRQYVTLIDIKQSTRPAFVVFQIKYLDPFSKKTFSQAFFLKFLGWTTQEKSFRRELNNADIDERNKMERYMKEREIPRYEAGI